MGEMQHQLGRSLPSMISQKAIPVAPCLSSYCTTYEQQLAVLLLPVTAQATRGYELLLSRHSTGYVYLATAIVQYTSTTYY